jgi:hypothetical protein
MAEPAATNFTVSANGGAGSAGQPAQYTPNMDNGGDFYELQTAAKMNKSGVNLKAAGSTMRGAADSDIVPIDAPSIYPEEGVDTGAALGPNAGEEVMAAPSMLKAQNDEDIAKLTAYLPVYARIAESPNATNSTRNFFRYIRSQVQG